VCTADAVIVGPDNLAQFVDGVGIGTVGAQQIVQRGDGAAAVEEAARLIASNDLARVVDAARIGVIGVSGAQQAVEVGISATEVHEAVLRAAAVKVEPDNLARVVDAIDIGAVGGRRIGNRRRKRIGCHIASSCKAKPRTLSAILGLCRIAAPKIGNGSTVFAFHAEGVAAIALRNRILGIEPDRRVHL